jgi:DNA-binding transcriptional regulator YdaS (Cro superfamily)
LAAPSDVGAAFFLEETATMAKPAMEAGIRAAIKAAGGKRAFARLLGITPQAIWQWDKVPAERILEIEQVTGVARERVRPDLYRITETST